MSEAQTLEERPISEDTPIKLRFVVLIVGAVISLLGAAFSAVWWASAVSTKLNTIVTQQAAMVIQESAIANSQTLMAQRISDLEAWKKMVDSQGDPAGRVRDEALQGQITQLRHDFDVMQAKQKP